MPLSIRLLLVEDEPIQARWIGDRLAADGIECLTVVVDREGALNRALAEDTYDLAICDYRLPEYHGMAALRLIRARRPGLPVIMMSAVGDEELVAECFRAGAVDYVVKSKPARFAPTVRRALRAAREQAEREELLARLGKLGSQIPGVLLQVRRGPDGAIGLPFAGGRLVDLFGVAPTEVREDLGALLEKLLPEDVPGFTESLHLSARTLSPWQHECRWRDASGAVRWLEATATPEPEPAGGVLWHGLLTEITARKELEANLEQMRDRALEASRLKSEFLANMSHEIRTPMNGIIGLSDLLLKSGLTADQREMGGVIRRSGESLLMIINEILDFSKIEAGRMRIDRAPFDLGAMVEDTCALLDATARQKGITLTCELGPDLHGEFLGDGPRIRQVLTNLVGNAIKFTPAGEVLVSAGIVCSNDGYETVRIEVQDSGIGIPAEAQTQLFQPFTQADGSTTRRFGGTGLGLAISLRLVELMGGMIDFKSIDGEGSTFWFELPLRRGAGRPAPSGREAGAGLAALRVLAVAADGDRRHSLVARLRAIGVRVEEATCVAGAVHRLTAALGADEGDPYQAMLVLDDLDGVSAAELVSLVRLDSVLAPLRVWLVGADAATAAEQFDGKLPETVEAAELRAALLSCLPAKRTPVADVVDDGAAGLRPPVPAQRLHLLVVEDNHENQIVARMLLEWLGHAVEVVGNGAEALAHLEEHPFDAVLMDCHMPVLDGFGATRRIRAGEVPGVARTLPVIALTANALPADRERCLQAGMTDYVSKPLDAEELRRAFERCGLGAVAAPEAGLSAALRFRGPAAIADWDPRPVRRFEGMVTREGASLAFTVLELFLRETASRLDEVERCFSARDGDRLEHAAHKLAGSAANVGAFALRDVLREIENLAADHSWAGVPERIEAARHSWLRLQPPMADYLSTLSSHPCHESPDR